MPTKTLTAKASLRGELHDIKAIKKLIYDTLTGDYTLKQLLGSTDSIYHSFPQTEEIKHPAIFYNIISEETYPYRENDENSSMTEIVFGIDVVDDGVNSEKSDNIENRVFFLLNGKYLKNSDVAFKQALKRTYFFQFYDSEARVWRTVTRYITVTAPI